MIDQTIPLPALCAGMARCVREWILPHVNDPMARTQAHVLASLLEALPNALDENAARAIARNSEATRRLLADLGEQVAEEEPSQYRTVDDLMRVNGGLKTQLETMAQSAREQARDGDSDAAERLRVLQQFFENSLREELGVAAAEGTDFKSMTEREEGARKN